MANSLTLEEEVHSALSCAVANESTDPDMLGPAEAIAVDLCTYSDTFSGNTVEELLPHVKSWQEKIYGTRK